MVSGAVCAPCAAAGGFHPLCRCAGIPADIGKEKGGWLKTGNNRVLRGGYYGNSAQYLRSAYPNNNQPDNANNNFGFRGVFVP